MRQDMRKGVTEQMFVIPVPLYISVQQLVLYNIKHSDPPIVLFDINFIPEPVYLKDFLLQVAPLLIRAILHYCQYIH